MNTSCTPRGRCSSLALMLVITLMAAVSSWLPAYADGTDLSFGTPGSGNGQFSIYVRGLDTDAAGNIYVLDGGAVDASGNIAGGNFRVQKFNSAGVYQSQFSVYDVNLGVNNTPTRIAVSDAGDVFILITNANQVRRYVNGLLTTTYTVSTSKAPLYQESDQGPTAANAGGIYVRTISGTPYLFVAQNNNTVRKITISNGTATNITLSRGVTTVTDLTVKSNGDLYLLGTDATTGAQNLLMAYTATGAWVSNYGSGTSDMYSAGYKCGDVVRHGLEIDSQGNVYSVSPGNEANILKYAFAEGLVYYRQGQYGFGDSFSIHGNDLYIAVDRNDRIYCLTTHSDTGTNPNGHHASPAVNRLVANYFTGAANRRLGALGLSVTYPHNLPYNVTNNLNAISYEFVVGAATRVVHTLNVSYHVYDINKTVVGSGTFTLNLTDGAESRRSMSFTPPKYGWYAATFDMYDTTQDAAHFLMRSAVYFGVTPTYSGIMPTLAAGSSPGGWTDPLRQAFVGLPFQRIKSTLSSTDIQNAITTASQNGVTLLLQFESQSDCTQAHVQSIVNQFQGQIQYYEVINEPNLFMSAATYKPILQNVYTWIKAIDANAQVVGPATCGVDLNWIQALYTAGGKNYFNILSVHDYEGHESVDPSHFTWKFTQLRSTMTTNGDGSKPIWQTEHGITVIRGGNFLGPAQLVRETLHRDTLDALGIVAGKDFYYYLNEAGFADYPSYLWSKTGPHPAALALRTRYALTRNTQTTGQLDFGTVRNKLFSGLRYTAGGTNIVLLRNLGADTLPLTLNVSGSSTVTVVDCFGNETTQSASGGQITLNLTTLPIYLKLASGQDISVPTVNYGPNIAPQAAYITYSSSYTGSMSTLNNGILETIHAGNPNTALWEGDLSSTPQTLDFTFASSRTIKTVNIYSLRADNAYCALLDFDLQYWNGTSWVTIQQVRSNMPASDEMTMFDHYAQAWYLDQNLHSLTFTPVTTTKLRISVLRTTYGFCPDQEASNAMQKAWGGTNPAKLHLHEIEIYEAPDSTAPATPTGLTASAGSQQVMLKWADNSESDLAGYNVYRSTTSGGSYTKINTSTVTTSAYTDTGLTNGTTYYYVVRACDGWNNESGNSNQVSAAPSSTKVAAPLFSPVAGTYGFDRTVILTCATSGATIRYTTNGSDPTSSSTLYSTGIAVTSTTTLKARAFKSGMTDSDIASATYTITGTATKLTGTVFGSAEFAPQNNRPPSAVYDGNTGTSFDALDGNGGYAGIDLGAGNEKTVCKVRFYFATNRGGNGTCRFEGSNTGTNAGFVTLANISAVPGPTGAWYDVVVTDPNAYRYLRYVDTDNSYCNDYSEVEFYTTTSQSPVATPTFSPAGGTYSSAQSVTISTTTSGATIRYTTDGSTPSQSNGTVYSTAVSISATTTLKAIAYKTGMTDSSVASATYTISTGTPTKLTGTAFGSAEYADGANNRPPARVYDGDTSTYFDAADSNGGYAGIDLGSGNASAVTKVRFFFNTNRGGNGTCRFEGSNTGTNSGFTTLATVSSAPGATGAWYEVTVTDTTAYRYLRYVDTDSSFCNDYSEVEFYTGGGSQQTVATPTFSPAAGTYTSSQSVTISTTTSGATIRYTTDGSTPTQSNGTVYSAAVNITATTTLKAIAYKTGMTDSSVASATYTIKVATPTFSPAGGTYSTAQSVTISCATSGATIRYTTNGTDPTGTSTQYTGAISVNSTTTIKARAFKTGLTDSDIASATYSFPVKLTGTAFGSPEYAGGINNRPPARVYDGDTGTYFDAEDTNLGYAGIDLGSGNAQSVTKVRFYFSTNRGGNGTCRFEGSNTGTNSGFTTLATVSSAPGAIGAWYEVTVSDATAYRYLRYVDTDSSYCNDYSEVEFYH